MNEMTVNVLLSVQENLQESQNYDNQEPQQQIFDPTPTPSAEELNEQQDNLVAQLPPVESQRSVLSQVLHKVQLGDKNCQEPQQVVEPEFRQKVIDNQPNQESQVLIKQESIEELTVGKSIPESQHEIKKDVSQKNIRDQPIKESELTEYTEEVNKEIEESQDGIKRDLSKNAIQSKIIKESEYPDVLRKVTTESQHEIKQCSPQTFIEVAVEYTDELTDDKPKHESQHSVRQDSHQVFVENIAEKTLTMQEQEGSKDHDERKQSKTEKEMSEIPASSENDSQHWDDKDVEELSWSKISDNILKINAGVQSKLVMLIAAYNQQRTESGLQHQEFKKRFERSFQREIDMIKHDVNRVEECVEELEDVADAAMERTFDLTDEEKSVKAKTTEADDKLKSQEEHAAATIGASQRKEKLFDAREVRLNDRARDTDVREFNYLNEFEEEEEMEEEIERQLDEEEAHLKTMLERRANRWKLKNLRRFFGCRKSQSVDDVRNVVEEGPLLSTDVTHNTSAQAHDLSDSLKKDSPGKMAALFKRFRRSQKQNEPIASNIDIEVPCSSTKECTASTDGNNETNSRSPSKASKLVRKLKKFSRSKSNGTRPNCM